MIGHNHFSLGGLFFELSEYNFALDHYLSAETVFKDTKDQKIKLILLVGLAKSMTVLAKQKNH